MTRHIGRHRAPKPAPARPDSCDLVYLWADDCARHLDDGRTLDDAGALSRIDLLDRLAAQAVAS